MSETTKSETEMKLSAAQKLEVQGVFKEEFQKHIDRHGKAILWLGAFGFLAFLAATWTVYEKIESVVSSQVTVAVDAEIRSKTSALDIPRMIADSAVSSATKIAESAAKAQEAVTQLSARAMEMESRIAKLELQLSDSETEVARLKQIHSSLTPDTLKQVESLQKVLGNNENADVRRIADALGHWEGNKLIVGELELVGKDTQGRDRTFARLAIENGKQAWLAIFKDDKDPEDPILGWTLLGQNLHIFRNSPPWGLSTWGPADGPSFQPSVAPNPGSFDETPSFEQMWNFMKPPKP